MNAINFSELPAHITSGKLSFDGDKSDLRLHSEENFSWGAKTKKEYQAACKAIDKISYKGEGWQLYAWYDVSSYDYWMKNMKEQNYIQISISFDSAEVSREQIDPINYALDNALADADALQYKYDFNPYID